MGYYNLTWFPAYKHAMKKLSSILIAVMCLIVVTYSSCRRSNTPGPSAQITGKWTMQSAIGHYIVLSNERRDTTKFTASDYMQFKADGTLTISESNVVYNGNWQITNNKLLITGTGYMDFSGGFDILTLTSNQLQIFYKTTDSNSILEQTLNLSR